MSDFSALEKELERLKAYTSHIEGVLAAATQSKSSSTKPQNTSLSKKVATKPQISSNKTMENSTIKPKVNSFQARNPSTSTKLPQNQLNPSKSKGGGASLNPNQVVSAPKEKKGIKNNSVSAKVKTFDKEFIKNNNAKKEEAKLSKAFPAQFASSQIQKETNSPTPQRVFKGSMELIETKPLLMAKSSTIHVETSLDYPNCENDLNASTSVGMDLNEEAKEKEGANEEYEPPFEQIEEEEYAGLFKTIDILASYQDELRKDFSRFVSMMRR